MGIRGVEGEGMTSRPLQLEMDQASLIQNTLPRQDKTAQTSVHKTGRNSNAQILDVFIDHQPAAGAQTDDVL